MFDHASSRRPYGMNHAGLVEYDHTTKKDIFYLYKALWNNEQPTLYIVDKGWKQRKSSSQQITVYSSHGEPTLTINGSTSQLYEWGRKVWTSNPVEVVGGAEVEVSLESPALRDSTEFRVVKQ
jgi:beta-galactosidase